MILRSGCRAAGGVRVCERSGGAVINGIVGAVGDPGICDCEGDCLGR